MTTGGRNRFLKLFAVIVILLLSTVLSPAAQIGELHDTDVMEQVSRFLSFEDASVRHAVIGALLMGLCCGLLGSFIVVRKLSLVGDTLSHAVLPGVALGFLWSATKDPLAIFIGATIAGLLGTVVVNLIKDTTTVKEDSALGLVLSGFYAVGVVLTTMIQQMETGSKSGINQFFFGQAAAISLEDLYLIGVVTVISLLLLIIFYKEFLVTSFDSAYASALSIPAQFFHYLLMLMLAFAVVVSLQATGVVLVTALLVTPAAAAYLLTDRMHWMLILSALFGMLSAVVGAFLSFLGNNLPTGPFIVVGATLVFAAAYFLGPRHGLIPRKFRERSRNARIRAENTLKAAFHVLEQKDFSGRSVAFAELAGQRGETGQEAREQAGQLATQGLAKVEKESLTLTYEGWRRACEIVRNHRLWELYLTHAADYETDHVHDDAEQVEHMLGPDTVARLEERLHNPRRDPHGKLIPSIEDMRALGVLNGNST